METEKQIKHICTIQRWLGVVEGVASEIGNEVAAQMLFAAAKKIDEAVRELTKAE